MIRTVLVPLDGSTRGERALPPAVAIARAAKAELKLVHVTPTGTNSAEPLPPTPRDYLGALTAKVHQVAGLPASSAQLHGPVAESLANYAATVPADLIVMTTHGRGMLSRLWLGSVTDSLIRRATMPLLLYRPDEAPRFSAAADAHDLRTILIALDGTPASEAVIAPAVQLGRLFDAKYSLLRVVEPMPVLTGDGMTYMPSAYDDRLFDELVRRAHQHLDGVAARLRDEGLTVTTRVAVGESPAAAIIDASKSVDITAVATHGRSGMAQFFLGSVADKVIRGSEGPVLVVRTAL